jgi:hypothetical protein
MTLTAAIRLKTTALMPRFGKFSLPNINSHEIALRRSPIRMPVYCPSLAKLQRCAAEKCSIRSGQVFIFRTRRVHGSGVRHGLP